MDEIEIKTIVHKVCSVYKNRGYVTVAEIQDLLDTYNASLVETNRVFQHLIEAGCKVLGRFLICFHNNFYLLTMCFGVIFSGTKIKTQW